MSMQIIEKSGEGLSRIYGVRVPAKDLGERLEARIAEIAPQHEPARIPPPARCRPPTCGVSTARR